MVPNPSPSASSGVKRPHSESFISSSNDTQQPTKRQRVTHKLHHVQNLPKHIEPAPQEPVFLQGQLIKSISAGLHLAGFDGVTASALEMFRAQVEESMLKFLGDVRNSMLDCRRTKPTALDFAAALAKTPHSSSASLLAPQLHLSIPQDVSCPALADPLPAPPPAPDFSSLLQPLITISPPTYIPTHFPSLPPQHAWKQTPVFPEREKDARKMREKATEEGMLAEQALRKLAAAAKTGAKIGATNAEMRRSSTLSGLGKARSSAATKTRTRVSEDTLVDVLKDVEGSDEAMDMGMDGARDDGGDLGIPGGVAVNHEIGHWRRHGASKALRA